jgi:hypothetical protein
MRGKQGGRVHGVIKSVFGGSGSRYVYVEAGVQEATRKWIWISGIGTWRVICPAGCPRPHDRIEGCPR